MTMSISSTSLIDSSLEPNADFSHDQSQRNVVFSDVHPPHAIKLIDNSMDSYNVTLTVVDAVTAVFFPECHTGFNIQLCLDCQ